MKKLRTTLLLACLGIAFLSSYAVAAEIPLNVFTAAPEIEQARLSPDGQSMAYIRNLEGRSYLIIHTDGKPPKPLLSTDNAEFFFNTFRWVNNKQLLVGVHYPDYRHGTATVETRLLAVNGETGIVKANLLGSAYNPFQGRKYIPQFQDKVIGKSAAGPDSVLIPLDINKPTLTDVYSLDVQTAQLTTVVTNPGDIYTWIADRQGNVRVGRGWTNKTMRVIVRAPGSTQWQTLSTYLADDKEQTRTQRIFPIGFDDDARFLYAYADHQGRDAIFRIDTSDPTFPRTLIHADDKYDVHGKQVYWDEQAAQLQNQLDQALPGMTNHIVSSSADGMLLLVSSSAPNVAAQLFRLDRRSGNMTPFAQTRPALADEKLPMPQHISFKSRDGTALHGYLTLPPKGIDDHAAKKPLPLIVLPHGGPSSRDVARFDIDTQFFASRGWAVLQVNFRGSSGYGSDFESAGFKRWGLEMQDDITDGVNWSIAQGIADPARLCIVGGSYGGYAAMMGIIKTPELYRCAISLNGVADLRALLLDKQNYVGYEIGAERMIGEWWNDRERLRQTSPINRVKEIRTPLLLIHGKQDRTVPSSQSKDMADELKSAGNTAFKYIELPLADHSLSREEDRVKTFTEMENFLKQYLN